MLNKEEWRAVVGYEGLYQVSNLGRVKNSRLYSPKTDSNKTKFGKIKSQRENNCGYYKVGLSKNRKQKWYFVHRLVAIAFIPNEYNKRYVNHKDGNKKNNHSINLEWVTPGENGRHAHANKLVDLDTPKRREMLERLQLNNCKKVTILDVEGNFLGVFDSLKDASLHFGFNAKYFSNVIAKGSPKYKVVLEEEE